MSLSEKSFFSRRKNNKNFYVHCVLVLALFSLQAVSKERSQLGNDQKLLMSCHAFKTHSANANTQACVFYIRGFISATLNTAHIKGDALTKESAKNSSFTERAYVNRVGKKGQRALIKKRPTHCPPLGELQTQILDSFAGDVLPPIDTVKALHDRIYSEIKKICSAKSK
ncbi:MAG: hypothetical protein ACPG52_09160 [Cognaticolwellia sp.]